MPKLTDMYVLPHFENLRERVNMICVLSNLLVAGLSHENLILKYTVYCLAITSKKQLCSSVGVNDGKNSNPTIVFRHEVLFRML